MFFTEFDPRGAVKGSRDPLGLQPVWTYFGRQVVGNLTTVTTSVRNFTTHMLGLHIAELAIESGRAREEERCELFLRFEQVAAYSRYAYYVAAGEADDIRGINRVRAKFESGGERVTISVRQGDQILSNQKIYGLWGLYSVPSQLSGWSDRELSRPSSVARTFVDEVYGTALRAAAGKDCADIFRLIEDGVTFEPKGRHRRVGKGLADILAPKVRATERDFLHRTLVLGEGGATSPTAGRQAELWRVLERVMGQNRAKWLAPLSPAEIELAREAAAEGGDAVLASWLSRIGLIEPVLALADRAFGFLLGQEKQRFGDVARQLRKQWGARVGHLRSQALQDEVRPSLEQAVGRESATRLLQLSEQLTQGDFEGFLRTCLEQNAAVMAARRGAPWAKEVGGRVEVALSEGPVDLPSQHELPDLWRNTYFIYSLKRIGASVAGVVN